MSSYRSFAIAAALTVAVGCGGADRAPDGERQGGGGANGVGDDARPTASERTGSTGDSGRGIASLSDEDRAFVEKASLSNQLEVTLGNLAEDKAQNDQVKQFAEQLARDHEAANRTLQSGLGGGDATTAQQPGSGTSAPGRPDAARGQTASGGETAQMHTEMAQVQQKLEGTAGAAFDRAYLEEMVKHHEKDIQEFERAAQSDNPQVRAFAQRTLPTLREHLQQAQQLQQSIR
jgi:putative membrane protein